MAFFGDYSANDSSACLAEASGAVIGGLITLAAGSCNSTSSRSFFCFLGITKHMVFRFTLPSLLWSTSSWRKKI